MDGCSAANRIRITCGLRGREHRSRLARGERHRSVASAASGAAGEGRARAHLHRGAQCHEGAGMPARRAGGPQRGLRSRISQRRRGARRDQAQPVSSRSHASTPRRWPAPRSARPCWPRPRRSVASTGIRAPRTRRATTPSAPRTCSAKCATRSTACGARPTCARRACGAANPPPPEEAPERRLTRRRRRPGQSRRPR